MALQMSVGVGFEKKMALRSPPGPPYAARVAVWMGYEWRRVELQWYVVVCKKGL